MRAINIANDIHVLEKKLIEEGNKELGSHACMDDQQYLSVTLVACTAVLAKTIEQAADKLVDAINGSA